MSSTDWNISSIEKNNAPVGMSEEDEHPAPIKNTNLTSPSSL
jgi:hypothetical protein